MERKGAGTPLRRLRGSAGGLSFDSEGRVTTIHLIEGALPPAEAVELAEKKHDLEAICELLGFLANAMTMEHPVPISAFPREVIAWGGRVLGNLRNGEEADEALGLERKRGRRKAPAAEVASSARLLFNAVQALRSKGHTYAKAVEEIAAAERVSQRTIKRAWSIEARRRYRGRRPPRIRRVVAKK